MKQFPNNSHIVEFCKQVISTLTPVFGAEIRAGRLGLDLARPSMDGLCKWLVQPNCRDFEESSRRQDIRGSEEWGRFVDTLAEIEKIGATPQAETPPPEAQDTSVASQQVPKPEAPAMDQAKYALPPLTTAGVALLISEQDTGSEKNKGISKKDEPNAKPGPKPKIDRHQAIAEVVEPYGEKWKEQDNLEKISDALNKRKRDIPPPASWAKRERPAKSWTRAVEYYPDVVRKVIAYSLKMAAKDIPGGTLANSR